MRVTFCGHGSLPYDEIENIAHQLKEILTMLIKEKEATSFLLGGYGDFDFLCARVVKELKVEYPHIKSTLIIPYKDRDFDKNLYDGKYYPQIETVPPRFAIPARNRFMVEKSEYVIAYVKKPGGAVKTLEYAMRQNKKIIHIK